ncbi:hypothetical protein ACVRYP_00200 [Streptococcus rifensis]
MTNLKLFHFIWKLKVAQTYNKIAYWLQKIPWLGQLISNRIYQGGAVKTVLHFVSMVWFGLKPFIGSAFYLTILAGIAIGLENLDFGSFDRTENFWLLLFVLSLIMASSMRAMIETNKESIMAVKLFRLPARYYYLFLLLIEVVLYLISFSLVLSWFCRVMGQSIGHAWSFTLLTLGVRLCLKYGLLYLYLWDKSSPSKWPVGVILGLCILAPFLGLSLYLTHYSQPLAWMVSPQAGIVGLLLIAIGGLLLWRTRLIKKVADRLLRITELKTMDMEEIATANLQVKDDDYDLSSLASGEVGHRTAKGIVYLNQIFYNRVGPHLKKKMRLRKLLITGLMLLAMIGTVFLKPGKPGGFQELLPQVFPISLMLGYLLYSGEQFTRFCFYHLDRKLLKYPFYRQPDQVLTALKIRFAKLVRLHLPLLVIVLIGVAGIYLLTGGQSWFDLFLLFGLQAVLMLFFSLFHLILYYLIQPFTEAMKTKSFTYQAINGAVYFLAFHMYRVSVGKPLAFFWGFLLVMALSVPLGLWAVLTFAPKHFRLRD